MAMVGNEDEYVLAMLLPVKMPWSESDQEEAFWNWPKRVFSQDDSWHLWRFFGNSTGSQQDEYVTAYPTKGELPPLDEAPERLRRSAARHVPLPPERLRQADPPQRAKPQERHATTDIPEVADP